MSLKTVFWILMLFWLIFSVYIFYSRGVIFPPDRALEFLLFVILGWRIFGKPVES